MPAIRTRLWVAVRLDFGVSRGALVLSGGIAASDTSGAGGLLLPGLLQTMPGEKQNSLLPGSAVSPSAALRGRTGKIVYRPMKNLTKIL